MGKGYNNFMCKKPFHPGSRDNMKRVWMAEQRTEKEKQREEELRLQYQKEQELYNNRLLVSSESKEKLSLNFMYEAPAGCKKDHNREDDEPEYKFEWQRNAPRESFAKNNTDIHDQPFGIQVKNVRCLKCGTWGHLNTDSECPSNALNSTSSIITGASASASGPSTSGINSNTSDLVKAMREEGLTLKKSLVGNTFEAEKMSQLVTPLSMDEKEMLFLKSLSKKEKKKMLKRLNALAGFKDSHQSKSKKKKKQRRSSDRESTPESKIRHRRTSDSRDKKDSPRHRTERHHKNSSTHSTSKSTDKRREERKHDKKDSSSHRSDKHRTHRRHH